MFEQRDVEDFILLLADIVVENRALRARVKELEKIEQEYRQEIYRSANEADAFNREFLKVILENTLSIQSNNSTGMEVFGENAHMEQV